MVSLEVTSTADGGGGGGGQQINMQLVTQAVEGESYLDHPGHAWLRRS